MFSSFVNFLNSLIFEPEVNYNADIKAILISEQVSNGTPQKSAGVVTKLSSEYGLIDGNHFFFTAVSSKSLNVGDKVSYSYNENGGIRSISNVSIMDQPEVEVWEEDVADADLVTVLARNERELVLSNDVTCHLDSIVLDGHITPTVGDIFKFQLSDTNRPILSVFGCVKSEGTIVSYDGDCGSIDESSTSFTRDILDLGYEPVVGDYVKFTAIRNITRGPDSLRAVSVTFLRGPTNSNKESHDNNSWNKSLIALEGSSDFGCIFLDSKAGNELTIQVVNKDKKEYTLKRGNFRRAQSQILFSGPVTPVVIAPGHRVSFKFSCCPRFVGYNAEVFDFDFEEFSVSRRFEMLVNSSEDFMARLPTDYADFRCQISLPVPDDDNFRRTYGQKPFRTKHFRRGPPRYAIPSKIEKAYFQEMSPNKNVKEEMEVLQQCCPVLKCPLNADNYEERWHVLLYLEEMATRLALARLSRSHVFFRRYGEYLVLDIPNLAEQRPSLIVGDRVVVTQPWSERNKDVHVGYIHVVGRDAISVAFHESFHNLYDQTDCNVRFEMSFNVFNHLHDAVKKVRLRLTSSFLFPTSLSAKEPALFVQEKDIVWCNKTLNEGQRVAVLNALRAECRPLPHIIFGPPGTGKTITLVESVLQILRFHANARILIAAPSNSAADLLAQRIIVGGKLRPGQLVRLMAFSRLQDKIPEGLEPYCVTGISDEEELPTGTVLGWHRVTIGTCTSIASLHLLRLPLGHFTHIILDEAGYATEPQLHIALSFLEPCNGVVILAGDPQQLGPVVLSYVAGRSGLQESFLGRLMARFPYALDYVGFPNTQGFDPRLITRLNMNYRSVPEILALPSRLFYNSELQAMVSGKVGREAEIIAAFHEEMRIRDSPVTMLFHGVRGENRQEPDSPSWLNPHELFESIQYVRLLYRIGVESSEIAVVTPYRKQVMRIRQMLTELGEELPKVGSVEELQGQERQVVILSCVRSNAGLAASDSQYRLGFLSNPRRVNVALTRARALLIVLGNPHLLCTDQYWRSVLKYCVERHCYIGCDLPPIFDSEKCTDIIRGPLTSC